MTLCDTVQRRLHGVPLCKFNFSGAGAQCFHDLDLRKTCGIAQTCQQNDDLSFSWNGGQAETWTCQKSSRKEMTLLIAVALVIGGIICIYYVTLTSKLAHYKRIETALRGKARQLLSAVPRTTTTAPSSP